ncbi:alpha-1,4-glucan:maltose-1-phosphate maltosyltransferase 2 [Sphaerisporangium melleum]|uniref:Alpha-1,4-glucan:maltose-1-phosphate maltosyltransferase n=1 Tax=Sphaerisporangium melleum TaxID=321316 RepID=A0A917QQ13_9ACTN|nr:alpha-1,4-glucan--maltose-1-phosphate maltosyltransferase [Sphaerisporangium melleum]GGK63214.1 alpha-1,4-glucan:maltose-1-phosphate maltosyltransferase 2 [Sphaerisporangium melleum]GII68059.1 alpha-1,4-glucan:maltose-1-phosphate maltosyltransferase 2 [Sphaerisporangium melleum]
MSHASSTSRKSQARPGIGRIVVTDIRPQVDAGARAARAVAGEPVQVTATVFKEGHDILAAEVVLWGPGPRRRGREATRVPMTETVRGTDRFTATITPDTEGGWTYQVEAWTDPLATWLRAARVKVAAGVEPEATLLEGAALLERAVESLMAQRPARSRLLPSAGHSGDVYTKLADIFRDPARSPAERLAEADSPWAAAALAAHPLRDHVSRGPALPLQVDRERALFGSWYEFFPRSEGARVVDGVMRSGTFRTAAQRLDAVAAMGFDVVYLPPIHPVGTTNRKGPGNTLTAGPHDPGSPWAIGSADGGHDAVHPDLGTLDDFRTFVGKARALGMEIALDFALQCSPDHPWVRQHPEWFHHRPDGSIAYAENPPKQYQDIYPISFDTDPEGLHRECLRVLRHWMDLGVRIFRVDNPHTKPLFFWDRLLADVRATDPDVIFLAEAFTRPAMLQSLARVGFHQSYTYFTWRTGKAEVQEYLGELAGLDGNPAADYLRPNLFVNTPDILPGHLVTGGRAAFEIRAVLAAMAGPTWGVYSGFELCEAEPAKPGSEEYKDSEKYQYRPRDHAGAEAAGLSLAPLITRLNRLRRRHPALRHLRNLRFHTTDNDQVICFSKRVVTAAGEDTVLVVLNLDPHHAQRARVTLDTEALGLRPADTFMVHDTLGGGQHRWARTNEVRLDPRHRVARIMTLRRVAAGPGQGRPGDACADRATSR